MDEVSTEELQLAYRVVELLAGEFDRDTVPGHVLAAAGELLRGRLHARTERDPIPGQGSIL